MQGKEGVTRMELKIGLIVKILLFFFITLDVLFLWGCSIQKADYQADYQADYKTDNKTDNKLDLDAMMNDVFTDQENWSHYDLYSMDRDIWFEYYDGDNCIIPYVIDKVANSPSGSNDIYYFEDESGKMKLEEVSKNLVDVMLKDMKKEDENRTFRVTDYVIGEQELYDSKEVIELMAGRFNEMKVLVSVPDTETPFIYYRDIMKQIAVNYPAIGEDMWLFTPVYEYRYDGTVSPIGPFPEDAGEFVAGGSDGSTELYYFVIMKEGNIYRMQRDYGFIQYAEQKLSK